MIFQQRDLGPVAVKLSAWIRAKLSVPMRSRGGNAGEAETVEGAAADVRVENLSVPSAGLSNETLLCDLRYVQNGTLRRERLVLRLEPAQRLVFPDYDLSVQWRILDALAATDVHVPRVRWIEPDAAVLGSPFYVMERVDGVIPSDVPPYHAAGFMTELGPAERAALWWHGLEEMARIHRLDPDALGLGFLAKTRFGTEPLEQELGYWSHYLAWAARGTPQPTTEAALTWLRENRPPSPRRRLCWGDARLPNLIFRGDAVVGVLDWEMAFLGDPAADLAWWLFLDWHHSEGNRIPRLVGLPSREETIARWERLTGLECGDLRYWEIFAAMRFAVIMVRVAAIMQEVGTPTPTPDFQTNNVPTQHLARLLGLPPPGHDAGVVTDVRDATIRVQFDLTGEGGYQWYLVADRGTGTRVDGRAQRANVTVTMAAADWHALQRGELDRAQAFLSGRLKIDGDISIMMQLEPMISALALAAAGATYTMRAPPCAS
jgi:aminoglycoside phosphotransferase (APT) family kinase protein/putative sterol carrier protein